MSTRHRIASIRQSEKSSVEDVPDKIVKTGNALNANPVDVDVIRRAATTEGGLLDKHTRCAAWHKLLGINMYRMSQYTGPSLADHKEYRQVKMDVDRCVRRIPPTFTSDEVAQTQEQALRIILRLLHENPEINYYQGLHDIVVTFVIEVGERAAYEIMNVLVHHHIRDFMDTDMERTKHLISFLPALLSLLDVELENFISRSNCNYYFTLSWLITWFGHEVDSHSTVVRLADLFLSNHPLTPLYVSAAIILSRRTEILSVDCEMSEVHGLLAHIPSELDWEAVITHALQLLKTHPPKKVSSRKRLSYKQSTVFNCHDKILARTARQLPDHMLKVNPYADETSLLVVPWKVRTAVKVLFVLSPILVGVLVWWMRSGFSWFW